MNIRVLNTIIALFFSTILTQSWCQTITDRQDSSNIFKKIILQPHDIEEEGKRIEKDKMQPSDYIPQIHGTIRGKYEYSPQLYASRFQVRNARFSITGNVHQMVAYKAEIDLSDKGKTKMLDAYVRVLPIKGLSFTLGQMKVPFSTDNLRSPHNYYFANRSFIAKQMTGLRDVGFSASYNAKEYVPISLTLGIFNGTGLYQQSEWQKQMNYSARLEYIACKYFRLDFNWKMVQPEDLTMNLFDMNMQADFYGVHLEAEAIYKVYEKNIFAPSYGFTGMANYDIKLPKIFDRISILARYDMMNNNSLGNSYDDGNYKIDNWARQRITTGVTLHLAKPILAELRINYEKYFYDDWTHANESEQDKIVIELVARF